MKLYFAKYLPVDFIQDTPDEPTVKTKLFLCSRDIQVGDKVCDKNDLDYPLWLNKIPKNDPELGEYLTEDNLYTYRNVSDTFKVIGEISPDALSYVKEGDEFGENQIRFQLGDFTPYEPESIDTISEEVFLSNIGKLNNNLSQWIEVKGPCGHFH